MKFSPRSAAIFVSLCSLILTGPARLRAQNAPVFDEVVLQKISVARAQPSTSRYLLSLAKAAKVNVLVDATNLKPAAPLEGSWKNVHSSSVQGQWSSVFWQLLMELSHERDLTWKRHGTRTFLAWPQPDVARFGRDLAAAGIELSSGPQGFAEQLGQRRFLNDALNTYYRGEHKWSWASQRLAPDVRLQDLPPALRTAIIDYASAALEHPDPNLATSAMWFDDKWWNSSWIRLREEATERTLMVGGADDPVFAPIAGSYITMAYESKVAPTGVRR